MTRNDYRVLALFVSLALLFTLYVGVRVAYGEGLAWGQAHQPARLVPLQFVLKDNDTCCVWVNGTKVCLPPAILMGTAP